MVSFLPQRVSQFPFLSLFGKGWLSVWLLVILLLSIPPNLFLLYRNLFLMEKPIKASKMADWSCGLPRDLLASILQRLSLEDFIRFGAVCVAWRSLVAERGGYPPSKLPWLLLPRTQADEDNGTCNFYSLSDRKEYKIHLPGVRWSRCIGSSDGWLVIHDEGLEMYLLNPLTKAQIQLPSIATTLPLTLESMEDAVVAMSWRSDSSYTAVFLFFGSLTLAFARSGDEAWTRLEEDRPIYDVVHHKGLFYIHDGIGRIEALDLTGPSPKFTLVSEDLTEGDNGDFRNDTLQLVESSGDLFQLIIKWNPLAPMLSGRIVFQVFKLDSSGSKWIEAKNLGNQALFLGREMSMSMSLSAHDFPGLKGNCIYFDDEEWRCGSDTPTTMADLLVFDLEDGRTKTYYPHDSHLTCPIPISFVPNLS